MTEIVNYLSDNASAYFNQLSELLLQMQITDNEGATLLLDEGTKKAAELIQITQNNGGKAMVIGNGGSAAIASHTHNDLCKAIGMRALVFNEPPLLMALANDYSYGDVFEHPIKMWADSNDLLIAISSSGQSENILRGVKAAVVQGCRVITLSGFKPHNPLRDSGDLNFYVSSSVYGYVELAHSILIHFLTDYVMTQNNRK